MNKRLLLCAMIVPGALAVSPMVSAQAKERVSLKEYQQAKASQAVSLNEAMVMAFENSPESKSLGGTKARAIKN
ncbi:hypothetical protein [Marinobacter sp. SS5-14b]|uniref:hypothetical protein n=1 Tax=Marinobacter sp. SS5-14b TaxID=3050456 RepID=UPI0026DFCCAE|nr:hypothetical protein [Marinobacter sp. SS5-14b]